MAASSWIFKSAFQANQIFFQENSGQIFFLPAEQISFEDLTTKNSFETMKSAATP